MRFKLLLAAAVLAAGCDKVVSTEVVDQKTVQQEVGCTHSGFCYACGYDYYSFHKGWHCGFGFKSNCDGKQQAEVLLQTVNTTYEREKDHTRYNEITQRRTELRTLTACQ